MVAVIQGRMAIRRRFRALCTVLFVASLLGYFVFVPAGNKMPHLQPNMLTSPVAMESGGEPSHGVSELIRVDPDVTVYEAGGSDTSLKSVVMPMSQTWAQEQFEKSLHIRKLSYGSTNRWQRCPLHHTTYYENVKTVFTGIPKAGHSNWLEALYIANGDMKILPSHGEQIKFFNDHPDLESSKEVQKFPDIETDVYSFTVIRNPWTRLVSGYKNKMTLNDPVKWLREERMDVVREMRGVNDPAVLENSIPTFDEFTQWLVRHEGSKDPHFKPQWKMLCIPEAKYDTIVPIEYASMLKDTVLNKVHANQRNKSAVRGINFLRLSYDGVQDPRRQHSVMDAVEMLSELRSEIIDKLYNIYRADFALLRYSNFTDPNFPLPLQYY